MPALWSRNVRACIAAAFREELSRSQNRLVVGALRLTPVRGGVAPGLEIDRLNLRLGPACAEVVDPSVRDLHLPGPASIGLDLMVVALNRGASRRSSDHQSVGPGKHQILCQRERLSGWNLRRNGRLSRQDQRKGAPHQDSEAQAAEVDQFQARSVPRS